MKNRFTKIILVLLVLLVLVIIGCDSLIAPQKARLNPYDTMNPVPAAANFVVTLNTSNPDNRTVDLSWDDGVSETTSTVEGYVVLRKTGSASESIWDGTLITRNSISEKTYIDTEFTIGTRNYYSVFSYGPKTSDLAEDQKLSTDANNNLANYENYNFTGPVTGSATPWDSIELLVFKDAYMENPPGTSWVFGSNSLLVECGTSTATKISCVTFDLTNTPDAVIKYVQLSLTKNSPSAEGSMAISALTDSWESVITWSPGIDTAVIFTDDAVTVTSGDADVITLDVTTAFNAWNEGTKANNGFRLRTIDGTQNFSFNASEVNNLGPKLRVWYFDE